MYVSRGYDENMKPYRELIIGYKTIFINTYTLVTKDLSGDPNKSQVIHKHESFHLWETGISGILLNTKDYVSFNKDGMFLISLGSVAKKDVIDFEK
jgi:hypothetical protein